MNDIRYIFYFAPHQDDELTNLGAAMTMDADTPAQVYCVLCTDGSASGARRLIGNGETCLWHAGRHPKNMDVPAFVAARDREYMESCRLLGLPRTHILIPENRARDGALTQTHAAELILQAIAGLPPQAVAVKTLAPVAGVEQGPDHTALGAAAETLFKAGKFASLSLFYEPIHQQRDLLTAYKMTALRPETEAQRQRLLAAAEIYGKWEPENGWYAVGWHSVYDEFKAYKKDPYSLLAD